MKSNQVASMNEQVLALENENKNLNQKFEEVFKIYSRLNSERNYILKKLVTYIPDLQGAIQDITEEKKQKEIIFPSSN